LERITPTLITHLRKNQIFVFGSNLAGRHGAGAAKTALQWGAVYGKGVGLQGQTYALPTKDNNLRTLSLEKIKPFVDYFIEFAKENKHLCFMVTEIGCGLAGHKPHDIAPLFKDAIYIENIYLPKRFII
jgi:hypothetical protein